MGAQVRPQDTRTPAQIDATIDASIDTLAERIPELENFRKSLKQMAPIHRSLAADTLELASKFNTEFLMTSINMLEKSSKTGKSLLEALLEALPKASKENPASLDLTKEVINNTDTLTSKYFLVHLPDIIKRTDLAPLMDASRDMVKPIAEATINGGYLGTFEKQKSFMDYIGTLIFNKDIKPESIKLLRKIADAVDNIETKKDVPIDFFPFLRTSIPKAQAEMNLAKLPQAIIDAEKAGKDINATNFMMHNVNFVKPQKKIDLSKEIKYVPAE